jgi:transposase
MARNQNAKIERITEATLIVGVDIAKHKHVARCVDWRGIELGKPLTFENTREGLDRLWQWLENLRIHEGKSSVIVGMEPTGHYWMVLAQYMREHGVQVVHVNAAHVKKSKELDDNSPTKNDVKDALTIARLVKDGRYVEPVIPEGAFAELRSAMNQRERLLEDLHRTAGRIHNWLDRYFPEFVQGVFQRWDGKAALATLRAGWLPADIASMMPEQIVHMWKSSGVVKGVGIRAAQRLIDAAKRSIGLRDGSAMARQELKMLISQYDLLQEQLKSLDADVEKLLQEIPGAPEMLTIPGVGVPTEVGDLQAFSSWQQIRKLAGLNLRENSSGMHKGLTTITKRGRSRLRAVLYRAVFCLVAVNPQFKALHHYYKTRVDNPLKPKQSLIALCGKLIRILFTLGRRRIVYDPVRALGPARQGLHNAAA